MTEAEEVIDALLGDCTQQCDGTYIETDRTLADYLQFDGLPSDKHLAAWTCNKCGSTVFQPTS